MALPAGRGSPGKICFRPVSTGARARIWCIGHGRNAESLRVNVTSEPPSHTDVEQRRWCVDDLLGSTPRNVTLERGLVLELPQDISNRNEFSMVLRDGQVLNLPRPLLGSSC